jgi:hypothetical protein
VLTLFFPKLGVETITLRNILQKLAAIIVVGIGTAFLFMK